MSERAGQWELLEHQVDPVIADTAAIDARLAHFRSLSESIRLQGQRLSMIASGDALVGKYADELRSASGAVAKDLEQVVGRYDAVVTALTAFQPEVDVALRGSAEALDDAIDANGSQHNADAMTTTTAVDGTELTADQVKSNADKTSATEAAADQLAAAKTKLAAVLGRFDDAARKAAATVRGGFNDGLKDSGWDRFKYAFIKFLKILVKVLTYIGMALAALAILIPGIGELVMLAGAVIGGAVLAADIALKAMGEGSWADIAIGIAGLLTLGAAKFFGPAIRSALQPAMSSLKGMAKTGWTAMKSIARRATGSRETEPPPVPDRLGVDIPMDRFTTYGRTDEEVLQEYTAASYTRMNTFTRGGELRSATEGVSTSADVAAIERALDARPPFIGTTTRGTSLRQAAFDSFQPGKVITSDALWSTSLESQVANRFGIGRGIDSTLTINGVSGRLITNVSLTAAEQEVLFKPWTTFRVDSKTFDPVSGRWQFGMTEVPRP